MTSFIIKPLTLLSNYQSKAVDVHHNDTRLSNAPGSKMLQMNVIEQGVLPGGNNGDNRRVGRIVNQTRFEWHYEYRMEDQQGISATNAQIYPTLLRHSFFFLLSNDDSTGTGGNVDNLFSQVFDLYGASAPDPHTYLNQTNLKDGRLIPLYDRTMQLSPMSLANKVDNVGVAPEVEYFYVSYIPQSGTTAIVEEGIIDLTQYYKNGLFTEYGGVSRHDIQTGVLIECWRWDHNEDDIFVQGRFRLWYNDK